jgi:hypothetical protein
MVGILFRGTGCGETHGASAAHGLLLFRLQLENFAALIVPAFGTGTMRHFALVTVGALGE